MRDENARLGVETTTRSDLTARSATKPRSSGSISQWHAARTDRNWLEKASRPVQGGPRTSPIKGCTVKRQQLQSLTGRHRAEYASASRVATGPVETADEAGCNRIAVGHENYRDRLGCRLDHLRGGLATGCSDHRDLTAHRISG